MGAARGPGSGARGPLPLPGSLTLPFAFGSALGFLGPRLGVAVGAQSSSETLRGATRFWRVWSQGSRFFLLMLVSGGLSMSHSDAIQAESVDADPQTQMLPALGASGDAAKCEDMPYSA